MSDADEIIKFFNWSPAKEFTLKSNTPKEKHVKLKMLCQTRWVERHVAIDTIICLLPHIVSTLEEYSEKHHTRKPNSPSASSLLKTATDFSFVVVLYIIRRCLSYLKEFSKSLQRKSLDAVGAFSQINLVRETLSDARENVQQFHESIFLQATETAEELGVDVVKPRTCGRQTQRSNVPYVDVSEYFRKSVTVPFLDTYLHILRSWTADFQHFMSELWLVWNLCLRKCLSNPKWKISSIFRRHW